MRGLEQVMQQVFSDRDLTPEQVPALDLYMDQVLTLFNDGLSDNKRHPDDNDQQLFQGKTAESHQGEEIQPSAHHADAVRLPAQANAGAWRCKTAHRARRCGF